MAKNEHSLQDLLNNFLSKNKKDVLYHECNIVNIWNETMGDLIVRYTDSISMQNGILYVRMLHAALRFELAGNKSELIRKLNDKAGVEVVKNIVFS